MTARNPVVLHNRNIEQSNPHDFEFDGRSLKICIIQHKLTAILEQMLIVFKFGEMLVEEKK
jgi:hypothetical protein